MEPLFILNTFKTNTPAGQSVAALRYVLTILTGLAAMFNTGLAAGQSTWMGMKFTTGGTAVAVNALGRIYAPNNSRTHQLKLVTANDGKDVAGSLVSLAMTGGTVGEFKYVTLGSTITLSPNTAYFLVSNETQGGDSWYGADSKVTTTDAAICQGGVYWDGGGWITAGGQGNALVPVDFTYISKAPEAPAQPDPPANSAFYRGINLNGSAVTIDGNQWEGSNAPNYSYSGYTFTDNNVTLNPATDPSRTAMIRSSVYSKNLKLTLTSVPSGSYQIYLYVWEDNHSEAYNVYLDGKLVKQNHSSGAKGSWAKLGPYSININDGTLEVTTTGGHANLSGIEVWKSSTAPTPAPVPDPVTDVLSGSYKITARHSGKALDVLGASADEDAEIIQWDYTGRDNQIWQIASTGNGYYKITSANSDKALTIEGNYAGNGGNLVQNTYTGSANQQWKIEPAGNGYYKFTARHSGKALDVYGISLTNGAGIVQWDYAAGTHQQWKLASVTGTDAVPVPVDLVTEQMGLMLTLHPNPADGHVILTLDAIYYGDGKLTITDEMGRVKMTQTLGVAPGKNTYTLYTYNLPTGIYFLKLQADGKEGNKKLVITR